MRPLLLSLSRALPKRLWLGAFIFCLTIPGARATTFNWPSTPGWTAGTPGQGATVTKSFISLNPNDITVAIQNGGADAATGAQAIIGPLTYTRVPEYDSACSVAATCLLAILGSRIRRRSARR